MSERPDSPAVPTGPQRIDPPALHATAGYAHVTVVPAGRTAYLAGQCPLDASGRLVSGGLAAQVDQVVANCLVALEAVAAAPADVVRATIYVVDDDSAVLAGVWDRLRASPLADAFTAAATLLGVAALGYSGQLVEVDLTAALPA